MTYANAAVGYVSLYQCLQLLQVGNAVVDEEHLSVAAHLEVHGIGNNLLIEDMQFGLYGIAVGWRRLYDGQVACSHERELQGARYGCCRQCKCVDIHLQLA